MESDPRNLARSFVVRLIIAAIFALAPLLLPAQTAAGPHWAMSYFYDEDKTSLAFGEIAFADSTHGVALAQILDIQNPRFVTAKPAMVVTADGGANWKVVRMRRLGQTIFFLNANEGWIAAEDGIWKTNDAGQTFDRISKRDEVIALHFLDSQHGFAAGSQRRVWETHNGGEDWDELKAAELVRPRDHNFVFDQIRFVGQHGLILGHPVAGLPQGSTGIETLDGGATWNRSAVALPGMLLRYRMGEHGGAYALLSPAPRANAIFIELDAEKGRQLVTKPKNEQTKVTDFAVAQDGSVWLATIERTGRSGAIPGKVRMLHSISADKYQGIPVDYRAVATYVRLMEAPGGGIWAVTDTGMILQFKPN